MENFWAEILAKLTPPTRIILSGMVIYFLTATIYSSSKNETSSKGITNWINKTNPPAMLTSFGIFGTFLGIFLGLWEFDSRNMQGSILKLLDGLTTAFISSVAGLGSSILFRIIRPAKTFAEASGEALGKALVEELKTTIREFNENLAEQLGENFKHLNEALGRLLQWQEDYKHQMDELKMSINEAIASIKNTAEAVQKIENATSQIPQNIQKIQEVVEVLDKQIAILDIKTTEFQEQLEVLAEIHDKAKKTFPLVGEKITEMTDNLEEAVNRQHQQIGSITQKLEDSTTQQVEKITQMADNLEEAATQQAENIKNSTEKIILEIDRTSKDIGDKIRTKIAEATTELKNAHISMGDELNKELENALQQTANKLGGIATKFSQDYDGLFKEMRNIIELAEKAKRNE